MSQNLWIWGFALALGTGCLPPKSEPIETPQGKTEQKLQQEKETKTYQPGPGAGTEPPNPSAETPKELPKGFLELADVERPGNLEKYDPERAEEVLAGTSLVYRFKPTASGEEDTRPLTTCFRSKAKDTKLERQGDAVVVDFDETVADCEFNDFTVKNFRFKFFKAFDCEEADLDRLEGLSLFDTKNDSICDSSPEFQTTTHTEMEGTMTFEIEFGGLDAGSAEDSSVSYEFLVRTFFGAPDGGYCLMANESREVTIADCIEVASSEYSDHKGPEWAKTDNAYERAEYKDIVSDRRSDYYIDGEIKLTQLGSKTWPKLCNFISRTQKKGWEKCLQTCL